MSDKIYYAIHSVEFKNDMLELAKKRPFKIFHTFPLDLRITDFIEVEQNLKVEKVGIEHHGKPIWDYSQMEETKETYISPFTGRVM